jgi:hypothetical protein
VALPRDAGDVTQDVDPPERFDTRRDGVPARVDRGDVASMNDDRPARGADRRSGHLQTVLVDIEREHVGPLIGQTDRYGPSHSRCGAGEKGRLSVESLHQFPSGPE